MNYLSSFRDLSRAKKIGAVLLVATLTWTIGLPAFFTSASAAQLASVSATASSSVPSAATNYIIRYTATSTVGTGSTIKITFSAGKSGGTDEFSLASFTVNDATSSQIAIITSACGIETANQASISGGISNSAGDRSITLTACGLISTATPKTIALINNHVTNPADPGMYKVTIGGTQADSGTTMVAIVNQVTVTAAVDATLTFTVAGVTLGDTVNGETVSTTSQATSIGFGVLASGTPVVAAQDLTVTTNASNGFIVTVHQDQDLQSSNGSKIHLFNDGAAVATPIDWATPTAALGNIATYGHIGLTTDDTDLGFFPGSVIKWVGNFNSTSTRTVFSNSGPADGTTQNIGKARVGYKILVSSLQAAASDYTNHLIYVCTPTF